MSKSNHEGPSSTGSDKERLKEMDEAAPTDARWDEILHRALEHPTSAPMATVESIRAGAEHMRQGRLNAMKTLLARVERKELVSRDEFRTLLAVSDEWIEKALADNRLFACDGPDDVPFFPAFFADTTLPRTALERVSQALKNLPGPVKYHFLTSKSTFLLTRTPLEAIRCSDLRLKTRQPAFSGFFDRN